MKILLDPDVEKVLEFMAREISRNKLVSVARAVAKVTELAWSDEIIRPEPINMIALSEWGGFPGQRLNDQLPLDHSS